MKATAKYTNALSCLVKDSSHFSVWDLKLEIFSSGNSPSVTLMRTLLCSEWLTFIYIYMDYFLLLLSSPKTWLHAIKKYIYMLDFSKWHTRTHTQISDL